MVVSLEDLFGKDISRLFFTDQLIVSQILDNLHFLVSFWPFDTQQDVQLVLMELDWLFVFYCISIDIEAFFFDFVKWFHHFLLE